jgi:hypothetical protein
MKPGSKSFSHKKNRLFGARFLFADPWESGGENIYSGRVSCSPTRGKVGAKTFFRGAVPVRRPTGKWARKHLFGARFLFAPTWESEGENIL